MKLKNYSRTWISLAACVVLSGTALTAHGHETSATTPEANQSGEDKASGMQHHYSHGNGYKGHHGKGHHGKKGYSDRQGLMMDLDLDDVQLEEIAEIQKELRSDLSELKVQRYEASLKLEELYAADDLDAGDIVDQQQKVFDVIKEITELQVEAQQDIRDALTTEQKSQLLRSSGWLMPN